MTIMPNKTSERVHVDTAIAYVCDLQAVEGCADQAFYSTSPTVPFNCSTHGLPLTTPRKGVNR